MENSELTDEMYAFGYSTDSLKSKVFFCSFSLSIHLLDCYSRGFTLSFLLAFARDLGFFRFHDARILEKNRNEI